MAADDRVVRITRVRALGPRLAERNAVVAGRVTSDAPRRTGEG
ncbi:MAG TPA: hypothetical protein VHF25_06195 [Nitriliruptorales bacterium]|nr:hypothetical protein [Nitriliruptorales bacterium]